MPAENYCRFAAVALNILVNMNQMRKRLLMALLVLGLTATDGTAQHFVYLQTADQTPFYVQLGGKTYSSTAAGYLLLGKLADSVYPIRVGVLGSTDVQEYGLRVAGKDAGYYIKKTGEQQAWTLINMLTGETQYSMEYTSALAAEKAREQMQAEALRPADSITIAQAMARRADSIAVAEKAAVTPATDEQPATSPTTMTAPFITVTSDSVSPAAIPAMPASAAANASRMLADSLARVIAEKEKELKALQAALAAAATQKSPTQSVAAAATSMPDKPKADAMPASEPRSVAAPAGQPALLDMEFAMPARDGAAPVAKPADSAMVAQPSQPAARPATDSGRTLPAPAAPDPNAGASQPARVRDVFGAGNATSPTSYSVANTRSAVPTGTPIDTPTVAVPARPAVVDTPAVKAIDTLSAAAKAASADTLALAATGGEKAKRSPCTSLLDREQLNQLQQQAARIIDIDEMVALYKKAFADHCITTSHLRRIVGGLASDVARYRLLEAAYPHTVDYFAFRELSKLLTDTYYLNQFKSLLGQ
jgi:hypothetical protein